MLKRTQCSLAVARFIPFLLTFFLFSDSALAQANRRLGTCGPPPKKNAERQTSAEGMPPLPLPVTPMRRSEPKAEPAPPIFVAKLEYGTNQDWNTDPGDVDSLLRHVRSQLNLWYGWRHLHINELVALHKADKGCLLPVLYITGHEAFQFTADQRAAIRQYVLDGGTLFGDACCGKEDFTASFRNEVRTMFPDRAFDLLEVDHPIYRAYYPYTKVNFIAYDGAAKKEFTGPPQMLGMNIGCRTAVILTPWDLSCGWDEHMHAHGKRILPGDAVRMGINLVSYIAGVRQLGEVQSTTREFRVPPARPRQQMVMAQLRHNGDWNPDPNSVMQWLRVLANDSSLSVGFDLKPVDANEAQLASYPFLFMTGHADPKLSDREILALRQHLQAGGFLFINNCCGRSPFDQHVRTLAARLFPDQKLQPVGPDHPLRKSFFTIDEVRDRLTGAVRPMELEGIAVRDRLVLVYSKNDMITHLKQVSDPYGNGYDAQSCNHLAVNLVAYALQH